MQIKVKLGNGSAWKNRRSRFLVRLRNRHELKRYGEQAVLWHITGEVKMRLIETWHARRSRRISRIGNRIFLQLHPHPEMK